MLDTRKKDALFGVFLVAAVVALFLEGWLVWKAINSEFGSIFFWITSAIHGTAFYIVLKFFYKLIEHNFLPSNRNTYVLLHQYIAAKNKTALTHDDHPAERSKKAIGETLKFAEATLHRWTKGSHFEFCVFVGSERPYIFCYFDTSNSYVARSMKEREGNERYYIEKKYEVVRILRKPSSQPHIIEDTAKATSGYSFVSTSQDKQIRSTILLSIDLDVPCALVVTSNEAKAFSDSNTELVSFFRFIAEIVRSDLFANRPVIDSIKRETYLGKRRQA